MFPDKARCHIVIRKVRVKELPSGIRPFHRNTAKSKRSSPASTADRSSPILVVRDTCVEFTCAVSIA